MTTEHRSLAKPARKATAATVRDRGQERRIIVTVYPSGMIALRLERCKREETFDAASIYSIAVKARVMAERAAKRKARKPA